MSVPPWLIWANLLHRATPGININSIKFCQDNRHHYHHHHPNHQHMGSRNQGILHHGAPSNPFRILLVTIMITIAIIQLLPQWPTSPLPRTRKLFYHDIYDCHWDFDEHNTWLCAWASCVKSNEEISFEIVHTLFGNLHAIIIVNLICTNQDSGQGYSAPCISVSGDWLRPADHINLVAIIFIILLFL